MSGSTIPQAFLVASRTRKIKMTPITMSIGSGYPITSSKCSMENPI